MSAWFSIMIAPAAGSFTAVTSALAAIGALGVAVQLENGAGAEPGGADGLIGAFLHGPRT
ncbi:MAG: hypothetical protein ACKN98_01135 [Candidatus Limnocylindrus sp.]